MYTTEWVEKLYRGFARNTTYDFEFVVFTDKLREYKEPIIQKLLDGDNHGYGDCIQPYMMDVPMILVGLDTIVCGNIDHLVEHCFLTDKIALPLDPYKKSRVCNGVGLVPGGMKHEYYDGFKDWEEETNPPDADMEWLRTKEVDILDDLFPGEIISFKGDALKNGWDGAKIVYFHGDQKPHQISNRLVREHWR